MVHCHILHLMKKTKRWWWTSQLVIVFFTWRKKCRKQRVGRHIVIFCNWNKTTMSQEVHCHLLQLKQNNNKLGGLLSFSPTKAKQPRMIASWDPSLSLFFSPEEKTKRWRQAFQFIIIFYNWRKKCRKWQFPRGSLSIFCN